MLIEHLAHSGFRLRALKTVNRLPFFNDHDRGEGTNAELLGQHLLFVGVDLGEQEGTLIFICQFLKNRHELLTGPAPVSPKIHHHRSRHGLLNQQLLRIALFDLNDVCRGIHEALS